MRHFWIASCLLGLAGCAQLGVPAGNREADENAIRDADTNWSKAAAAKNLDQVMSSYADDASLFAPGQPMATGPAAIRQVWTGMMAMPGFAISWTPIKVDVARSGDLGYSYGSYNLMMNDAQGRSASERGKYVVTWRKASDGKWKAEADIFNSDMPAAAGAPAAPQAGVQPPPPALAILP